MATDLPHVVNTLRSFGAQTHFALGNHDINSNIESVDLWKKWTHTSINNGENYYALDIKDIHVIVLDTVLGHAPTIRGVKESSQILNKKNPSAQITPAHSKQKESMRTSKKASN